LKAYKEYEGKTPLVLILDTDKIRVSNSLGSYIRMVLISTGNGTAVHMKLILVFNVPYRQCRKMLEAGKTSFLPDP
jgi:prephenate dehydratase